MGRYRFILHLILLCLNFAQVLLHSVCKITLLHQGYFENPGEQHKLHMLINMEQLLLLMLHALEDMQGLGGALGLSFQKGVKNEFYKSYKKIFIKSLLSVDKKFVGIKIVVIKFVVM